MGGFPIRRGEFIGSETDKRSGLGVMNLFPRLIPYEPWGSRLELLRVLEFPNHLIVSAGKSGGSSRFHSATGSRSNDEGYDLPHKELGIGVAWKIPGH